MTWPYSLAILHDHEADDLLQLDELKPTIFILSLVEAYFLTENRREIGISSLSIERFIIVLRNSVIFITVLQRT
jgi:hypothetical protein